MGNSKSQAADSASSARVTLVSAHVELLAKADASLGPFLRAMAYKCDSDELDAYTCRILGVADLLAARDPFMTAGDCDPDDDGSRDGVDFHWFIGFMCGEHPAGYNLADVGCAPLTSIKPRLHAALTASAAVQDMSCFWYCYRQFLSPWSDRRVRTEDRPQYAQNASRAYAAQQHWKARALMTSMTAVVV